MGQNEGGVADPYVRITGRILEQLEQGVRPWTKPWSAEQLGGRVTRPLRSTGEAYQGINVLLLWIEAVAAGRVSSIWMTYRQALALGGQVRRGERGCPVVYFGKLAADSADAGTPQSGAEEDAREVRFLRPTPSSTWSRSTVCRSGSCWGRRSPLPSPHPAASVTPTVSSAPWGSKCGMAGLRPTIQPPRTGSSFRRWRLSTTPKDTTRPGRTRRCMRPVTLQARSRLRKATVWGRRLCA